MKKKYRSPSLDVQKFATNESVAACYLVYCDGHDDMSHGDRSKGKPVYAVSEETLLSAGAVASDLTYLQENTKYEISKCYYDMVLELGQDGSISHPQVLVSYDPSATNFGS